MGQSFNPANMLAIPLTLGINVSYAIQLVHRHRQAHAVPSVAGAPALIATSTGRGVLLSAATNVVGFGALMLAHHRGTLSIGLAITIGVLGCLSASLVFLPALLRAWTGPTPAPSLVGPTGPKIGPEGRVARPESVP
jgi:predicted RND superfamily exporter protein